jgi:NAD+ synthase (glutamine-hydrolysing)
MPILKDFIEAIPTAELEPITADYVRPLLLNTFSLRSRLHPCPQQQVQSDEVDMQMTYAQLSRFGTLRKVNKLGPYGVFLHLQKEWGGEGGMTPREVAHKVKLFFHFFQVCVSFCVCPRRVPC